MKIINTVESGPSAPARFLTRVTRSTVRPALRVGCKAPHMPWPYGVLELAARAVRLPDSGARVHLSNCTATIFNPSRGIYSDRVMLYLHGGGFLACGPNTHAHMIERLGHYADCLVVAVDYRMLPKHSVGEALSDCLAAYDWLRESYQPGQIAIAGDSAGGYLALALSSKIGWMRGETPAALCLISPFLQFDPEPKKRHPNISCDAMFGPETFDALVKLVKKANRGDGVYEPLDDLAPSMPPTLIHVSGHEVLLHDARLAATRLSGMGVPVEVHVWPAQIHVFQAAVGFVPEAKRSLQQIGEYIKGAVGAKKTAPAMT